MVKDTKFFDFVPYTADLSTQKYVFSTFVAMAIADFYVCSY